MRLAMLFRLAALAIGLYIPTECLSATPGDTLSEVASDLDSMYRVKDGLVSGACKHRQDGNTYRIYLLLPRDRTLAWVVELSDPGRRARREPVMANIGDAFISKSGAEPFEHMGGVWTTEMLRRATTDIMKNPMFVDFSTADALKRAPTRSCPKMD